MTPQPSSAPKMIDDFTVLEAGSFDEPRLPLGYLPPPDGSAPLEPVTHVAIC